MHRISCNESESNFSFHSITVKLTPPSLLPNCLTHKGTYQYKVITTVFDKTRKKVVNQTRHNTTQQSQGSHSIPWLFLGQTCYVRAFLPTDTTLIVFLPYLPNLPSCSSLSEPKAWNFAGFSLTQLPEVAVTGEMEVESEKSGSVGKVWSFCRKPFWQTTHTPSSSSSSTSYNTHNVHQNNLQSVDRSGQHSSTTVSSVAKSFLPTKRRLRLDPTNKLYFPCRCLLKLVYTFRHIFSIFYMLSIKWKRKYI